VGYLHIPFFVGSIFIINITKGVLENKVENLAIYKLINLVYIYRYFEREDFSGYSSREKLISHLR